MNALSHTASSDDCSFTSMCSRPYVVAFGCLQKTQKATVCGSDYKGKVKHTNNVG